MFKKATLLSLLALSGFAGAADTSLTWSVQSYSETQATVGDSVTFTYSSNHNVYIHPTGDCSEDGRIMVGDNNASPVTYTFTADEVGTTVVFACDTGSHCESGQIISYAVVDTGTTPDTGTNTPDTATTAAPTTAPNSAAAKATLSVATVAAAFAMML
jgi:hypothetical protein